MIQTPDGIPSEVCLSEIPLGFQRVSRCERMLSFFLEVIPYDTGLPLADWLGFLGSSLGPSLSLPCGILSSFLDDLCLSLVCLYHIMLSRPVSISLLVALWFGSWK